MKKSVCLMAILGAFAASPVFAAKVNQTVNVKFTGEVVNTNCTIAVVNGQQNTVKLGNLNLKQATQDGHRGELVPVVFKFTGCEPTDNVTAVKLVSDVTMSDPSVSDVSKGVLTTDKPNVVVQIYKDKKGTNQGLADVGGKVLTDGSGYLTVGYAALKRLAKAPAAGPVAAEGMFEVTYN